MMKRKMRKILMIAMVVALLIIGKVLWVMCATWGHGSIDHERGEIIRRANYLVSKVATTPIGLLHEMPDAIDFQFRGEWALYSCSMTTVALANIATLYPEQRDSSLRHIEQIIDVAMVPEIRLYDKLRWGEDPLESLDGNNSHISYLSHLAWMIGTYKQMGGGKQYDATYHAVCEAMNRRIVQSGALNLPTYPGESIYVPDMLVAVVALAAYSQQKGGEYASTVQAWLEKAKRDWIDDETGLLASCLTEDEKKSGAVKGSYSALNCYYLTFIDRDFARQQYERLKEFLLQTSPLTGIREYHNRSCWLGMDIDAGPIVCNLSPSGTAFAIGCATYFDNIELRKRLLKTAEIAGSTFTWGNKSHYWLADFALVGEAITLAMRTHVFFNCELKIEN